MIEPYNKQFGTTFGKWHSARDFGLYPRSKPVIASPEVQTSEIEIPGREGKLDMTEALDGMVHYYNREGTFEFSCFGRHNWDKAEHLLKNRLHGKKMKVVLDEFPMGYLFGRLFVEEPEYDDKAGTAYFTVRGDFEPYKYSTLSTLEDWPWDPFSFPNGIIRNYHHIQINTTDSAQTKGGHVIPARTIRKKKLTYASPDSASTLWTTYTNTNTLTIYGGDMPAVPNIIKLSGDLQMKYPKKNGTQSEWVTLSNGSNQDAMSDFVISSIEPVDLVFSGAGIIQIDIELGWL